jgi:hypothetical protein
VLIPSRAPVAALVWLLLCTSPTVSSPAGSSVAPFGGFAPAATSPRSVAAAFVLGAPAAGGDVGGGPGGGGGGGGCDLTSPCGAGPPGFPGVGGGGPGNSGGASTVPDQGNGQGTPGSSDPAEGNGGVIGWIQDVFTGGSGPASSPAASTGQQDRPVVPTTREVGPDPRSDSAESDTGGLWGWLSGAVRGGRDPGAGPAPSPATTHTGKSEDGTKVVRGARNAGDGHGHPLQLLGLLFGLVAVGGGIAYCGIVGLAGRGARGARADAEADSAEEEPADSDRAEVAEPAA